MEKQETVEKQWRVSDITNPTPPPARSPTDSSLSSCRSSLDHGDASQHLSLHSSPPLQLHSSPPTTNFSASPPTTNFSAAPSRSVPAEPVSITKPHRPGKESGGGGGGGVSGLGTTRRLKTVSRRTVSELVVKKAALVFRFFGFVFCLVSFSIMAADRNKGWAVDSFNRYIEFRYCIAVNAIGGFYSALQGLNLAYQLSSGKLVSGSHLRYIFDFAVDQVCISLPLLLLNFW
ncbi:hypothetical protein AgCh_008072 [Apium graveolens]